MVHLSSAAMTTVVRSSLERQREAMARAVRADHSTGSLQSDTDPPPDSVRTWLREVLASHRTEGMLAVAIAFNLFLITVETDRAAAEMAPLQWVETANHALLSFYTLEMAARLYAFRMEFFHSKVDILDLLLIFSDVLMLTLDALDRSQGHDPSSPSFSFLRVLRLLRLARSIRVLQMFPQLALMVHGVLASIKLLFYGTFLLTLTLFLSGIMAVHLVHPVNQRVAATGLYDECARCARAYESVPQAMLTFSQQLIAGDSWGMVSLPIIEESPGTVFFFVFVFVVVQLLVMNVILSMVVEVSLKAAAKDTRAVIEAQERANVAWAGKLKQICQDMDVDGSGFLSEDELLRGFDENADFKAIMRKMKFNRADCPLVFNLLDTDKSGDVDYTEFVDEVRKMHDKDADGALFLLKYHMAEVKVKIRESMEREFDTLFEILGYNPGTGSGPHKRRAMASHVPEWHLEDGASIHESLNEIRRLLVDDIRHLLVDDISGNLRALSRRSVDSCNFPAATLSQGSSPVVPPSSAERAPKRHCIAPGGRDSVGDPAPPPQPRAPPQPVSNDAAGRIDLVCLPPTVAGM